MKHLIITAFIFSAVAISCTSNETKKDDSTVSTTVEDSSTSKMAETPDAPMDSATMMKAWQAYMTGEEHKMIAKLNGSWHEDLTFWMDPNAPAQKSTATCENKMILNGLYQQSVHKGNFEGMPFEGIGTMGFDNIKKVFVSSWIDNMGSGIMHMEGTMDPATKIITMKGIQVDPTTGKEMEMRETFKIVDDKTRVMEMYCNKYGKEFKNMEIKFTKK